MTATTDPAWLRALFDKPPEEAVAFLRDKGLRITFNWREMADEAHARAFTVAKAMRLDVLRDIRTGLLGALRQGKTLRQFQQELEPLLRAKGWWGKQVVVDGAGNAEMVELGSLRRLRTIYQTNLQSAYMAGRAQAQAAASAFPYLMYVAVMDSRTRPSHAALHGRVWRKDDPVWQVLTPPNGFNCRCRTRALTEGQMRREGRTLSPPPELLERELAPASDNPDEPPLRQAGVRVRTGTDANDQSNEKTMWVDVGFGAGPLAGHPMDELLMRKAAETLGEKASYELVQAAVTSETRLRAWTTFVDNTVNPGFSGRDGRVPVQGQTMTVATLPYEVAQAATSAELPRVAPVLHVSDRLLVGKKATRHAVAGNDLTLQEWQDLPHSLEQATWYLDIQNGGKLVAIMDGGSSGVIKAVFDPLTGAMDTAFKVDPIAVETDVAGGAWKFLGGVL